MSHSSNSSQSGVRSSFDDRQKGLLIAGSTLPVELWFLEAELPTERLGAALQAQGATLRTFPAEVQHLGGFALKAAALLLSGFEEVLLQALPRLVPHTKPCYT